MTKTCVLFGFLIALSTHLINAEAQCLKYNEDGVVLTGKVVLQTFFGPPNYGEDPTTDSKEKQAILKLDQPICVSADPKNNEDAEAGQTEVTLVPMQKSASVSMSTNTFGSREIYFMRFLVVIIRQF